MTANTFRFALRDHTHYVHEALDAATGEFSDMAAYRRYLRNTYRFRALVESACTNRVDWTVQPLVPALLGDLSDLDMETPPADGPGLALEDASAQLGALYVLEGSALGARLLVRRAAELGLTAQFGARHLYEQVSDPHRWRRFAEVLETTPDRDRALHAARQVFDRAHALYTEDTNERV